MYSFKLLLLFFRSVQFPLLLHILQKLLAVYQKLMTRFTFPVIDLSF